MNPESVLSVLVNTTFLVIHIYLRGEEFNTDRADETEILL